MVQGRVTNWHYVHSTRFRDKIKIGTNVPMFKRHGPPLRYPDITFTSQRRFWKLPGLHSSPAHKKLAQSISHWIHDVLHAWNCHKSHQLKGWSQQPAKHRLRAKNIFWGKLESHNLSFWKRRLLEVPKNFYHKSLPCSPSNVQDRWD